MSYLTLFCGYWSINSQLHLAPNWYCCNLCFLGSQLFPFSFPNLLNKNYTYFIIIIIFCICGSITIFIHNAPYYVSLLGLPRWFYFIIIFEDSVNFIFIKHLLDVLLIHLFVYFLICCFLFLTIQIQSFIIFIFLAFWVECSTHLVLFFLI